MQGITFSALQALEKRTSQLQGDEADRILTLEKENADLRKMLMDLKQKVERLEK